MLEDVLEHGVCRHFTYDVREVVDALAEVLRYEVAREAHGEAILHAVDGVKGVGEGFVVAGVGDDDVALRDVGQGGGLYQMGFKGIKPELLLGGDEELGGIDMGIGLLQCGTLLGRYLVALIEEEEEGLGRPI